MKTHAQATIDEALAQRALANAAVGFAEQQARLKNVRNVSGLFARSLRALVEAARIFAKKSDEAWAAEVVELRAELTATYAHHRRTVCPTDPLRDPASTVTECGCPEFDRTRELLKD